MSAWNDEEQGLDYVRLVHSLGELIFEGRGSYFGWLTPGGLFIGTGYAQHDQFARRILGSSGTELESLGWVKVSHPWRPNLSPGAELTEAQAKFLLDKVEADER